MQSARNNMHCTQDLNELEIPASDSCDMWWVGILHNDSRGAFVFDPALEAHVYEPSLVQVLS